MRYHLETTFKTLGNIFLICILFKKNRKKTKKKQNKNVLNACKIHYFENDLSKLVKLVHGVAEKYLHW